MRRVPSGILPTSVSLEDMAERDERFFLLLYLILQNFLESVKLELLPA